MEPAKKEEIIEDLVTFSKSKDFYGRIGKAWKRGYLLYGPPGTGKSTMIAAMANLLNYDVYDLELTAVKDNTELRRLLIETTSKSIIVIEDIDCSLDLTGQRTNKREEKSPDEIRKEQEESSSKVTLSGLLNFIDGLCFEAFKVLSRNYLRLEAHPLFDRIESLMKETTITPADVAENLMPKSPLDAADKCLSRLIQVLEETKAAAAAAEKDEKEASTKNAQSSIKAAEVPAMEDAACPTTRKLSPTSQNMK
ncbi:ATP BINDING PROTEIN [Salix viminalis]|uniref:ATP BINDING PROTEIN n=1 Tax=Salix viminalis TaxID=40686 RepID=A0A9Q0NMH5_SALVM|nr:ATP BINDING PROTEIN [Salix viminalis]